MGMYLGWGILKKRYVPLGWICRGKISCEEIKNEGDGGKARIYRQERRVELFGLMTSIFTRLHMNTPAVGGRLTSIATA